jgi:hypothetical protein
MYISYSSGGIIYPTQRKCRDGPLKWVKNSQILQNSTLRYLT